MAFDYSKLRGKIREVFGTQESFAVAMKMSTVTLSAKLNGRVDWTQAELERLEKQKQKEQEEFEKQYNPFGTKQNPNNPDDPPDDQGGDE